MAFDIYLLDKLDYDDAEPLLDDYIEDALQTFVKSKAGQAHIQKYAQGGMWIGTFVEMGYLYGGYTLPKMTKGNAQEIMEYILPRKLTLLNPNETDGAIAELTAFWKFLDEDYRFRSAKAIVKYLATIEDKFPQWMFDPNRGGFAKQFLMEGNAAGFDMSTQEGIEAFQSEFRPNLPQPSVASPMPSEFSMTTPPPDMLQAFELLGLELPKMGEMVDPTALIGQFLTAMESLKPDEADQLLAILEKGNTASMQALQSVQPTSPTDLRIGTFGLHVSQDSELNDADEALLNDTQITATTPGTLLQDLETTLNFIQEHQVTLSGKLKHFSAKLLEDLNQRLANPIEIDLKRPQQKSYPNIHGLYLLLRATNLTRVVTHGRQSYLEIHPEVYASWQQLNPTEKYCSLLEIWFLRSHPEMLGEERSGPLLIGDRCLQSWSSFTAKKTVKFATYAEQDSFFYHYPGVYNVALMAMFGWLNLTYAKPDTGKGWRVKQLEAVPLGKAFMALLHDAYVMNDYEWPGMENPELPIGDLQPFLQPYFPDWKRSLLVPTIAFRPDRHIFKVSLGRVWRRIAISGEATLDVLSSLILDSVDFDHDHLDKFTFLNPSGRMIEVFHPWYFNGPVFTDAALATDAVKIGSLPLAVGDSMEYLFDFGDCWEFQVQLEAIGPSAPGSEPQGFAKIKGKKKKQRSPLGEILETHGKAPQQYPDYDEDD